MRQHISRLAVGLFLALFASQSMATGGDDNCTDPICGSWELVNQSGIKWIVAVNSKQRHYHQWSFQAVIIDLIGSVDQCHKAFLYVGALQGRFNKISANRYGGQTEVRRCADGLSLGWSSASIVFHGMNLIQVEVDLGIKKITLVGRRQNKSSTTASSSGSTSAQAAQTKVIQLPVAEKAAEIEFWKSVKDSNDPDMYKEYLRQFPEGVYAGLAKIKIKKLGSASVAKASIPNLDYGRYHALVIGNNNYRNFRDLTTAISDAREVGRVLEAQYGFDVTLLTNATRQRTLKTFNNLRKRLSVKDNLLIYFAGHGHLHKEADEGYWLPVDAEQNDFTNWISNADVIASVRAMEAKHVLVIADSCFSGTLVRAIKVLKKPSDDYLKKSVKRKARTAISSGGLEPVTDVGGGKHSIFAHSLLGLLRENDGVLNATHLFVSLRDKVELNSNQVPVLGNIRKAGHDGGDFLFVKLALQAEASANKTVATTRTPSASAESDTTTKTLKARHAEEITTLQREHRALVDELKNQYSLLQTKFDRVARPARPARTFLGKYVVRIGYWKEGGISAFSLQKPGETQARVVGERQLHRSLASLKKLHGKRLYTKLVFPREAELSQKDAWQFTYQILRQYDYYAQ